MVEELKKLIESWRERAESSRPRPWAYDDGRESDAFDRCADELEELLTPPTKDSKCLNRK